MSTQKERLDLLFNIFFNLLIKNFKSSLQFDSIS